jgi:8-oxo-dGTP pyrophosphatase MutT (NUDIX family)
MRGSTDVRLDLLRRSLRAKTPLSLEGPFSQRAAVAIMLRDPGEGLEVLFIRRAENPQDPWSGQVAFPGGRFEPQDADLRATARRETLEETGLDLSRSEFLGALDEIAARGRLRPVDLSVQPFVFALEGEMETRASGEVESLHWIPLDRLLAPKAEETFEYHQGDTTVRMPCLSVGPIVIWGLTYRMFLDLKGALASQEQTP